MSMSSRRETAQIIPFVPRARMTQPAERNAAARTRDFGPQLHPTIVCGSGWYHEAAIQEEAQDRRS